MYREKSGGTSSLGHAEAQNGKSREAEQHQHHAIRRRQEIQRRLLHHFRRRLRRKFERALLLAQDAEHQVEEGQREGEEDKVEKINSKIGM